MEPEHLDHHTVRALLRRDPSSSPVILRPGHDIEARRPSHEVNKSFDVFQGEEKQLYKHQ